MAMEEDEISLSEKQEKMLEELVSFGWKSKEIQAIVATHLVQMSAFLYSLKWILYWLNAARFCVL